MFSPLALSSTINGYETGFIHLSLHTTIDGPDVWTSPKLKWSCDKEDRLEWSDIEIDSRNVNLGLKVAFSQNHWTINFT